MILWTLQISLQASDQRTIGVYVAALNIARVPSMALTTVTTIILPSLSRALAIGDEKLARRYINQSLRFGLMLYLPISLLLVVQAENLMQWIYSKDFSGGGVILALLVLGEGLRVVHAILGAVLNAAGEASKAAVISGVSLLPGLVMLVLLIHVYGGIGAALASAVILGVSVLILSVMIWRRFGTLMNKRSACNIGAAAALMVLVFALLPNIELFNFFSYSAGLAAYFVSLILLREITAQDFTVWFPGSKG
jgi:O-antigen/teichoic acid export membrane protein